MLNVNKSTVFFEYHAGRCTARDPRLPQNTVRIWEDRSPNSHLHLAFEFSLPEGRDDRFMHKCCAPPGTSALYVMENEEEGGNELPTIQHALFCLLEVHRTIRRPTYQGNYRAREQSFAKRYNQLTRHLADKDYFYALAMLEEKDDALDKLAPI